MSKIYKRYAVLEKECGKEKEKIEFGKEKENIECTNEERKDSAWKGE